MGKLKPLIFLAVLLLAMYLAGKHYIYVVGFLAFFMFLPLLWINWPKIKDKLHKPK